MMHTTKLHPEKNNKSRGRNGPFCADSAVVFESRMPGQPIVIDVYSKQVGNLPPISLRLSPLDAEAVAVSILKLALVRGDEMHRREAYRALGQILGKLEAHASEGDTMPLIRDANDPDVHAVRTVES